MRKSTITFLICILSFSALSQNESDLYIPEDYKLTPISPNAASLGIYGSHPVGHYTGIPSISVPLYEINLDGKTIPINLSYHASGIKVQQEASWVGLGWSLNAGGCITREMKGLDDFSSGSPIGYYNNTNFLHDLYNDIDPSYYSQDNKYIDGYVSNLYDGEPDLFHYNFCGTSGTFFLQQGNNKAILRKRENYLDVSYMSNSSVKWIIKDGDGYSYYFGKKEITYTNSMTQETYTHRDRDYGSREIMPTVDTAWYLDSIVSPKNNKITFKYESDNILSQQSISQDVSIRDGNASAYQPSTNTSFTLATAYRSYTYSYSQMTQLRVSEIVFPEGTIKFSTSERLDLDPFMGSAKARKLDKIQVYNNNNNLIRNIALDYFYNGDTYSANTCRLMLNSIKEKDNSDITIGQYKFTYNPGELPPKSSYEIDYWGYYNGKEMPYNTGFILTSPVIIGSVFYEGKDLSPNRLYMKYGILQEIEYPTGGKSEFTYSPHTFSTDFEGGIKKSTKQSIALMQSDTSSEISYSFTVSKSPATFSIDLSYDWYMESDIRDQIVGIFLYRINGSSLTPVHSFDIDCTENVMGSKQSEIFTVDPGEYQFTLRRTIYGTNNRCMAQSILYEYSKEKVNNGGGLKIDKIITTDRNNEISVKEFSYKKQQEKASGILTIIPEHYKHMPLGASSYYTDRMDATIYQLSGNYINGTSSPYTLLSNSAAGSPVGYSYVEEIHSDGGNVTNGKIIYEFHNNPDFVTDLSDMYIPAFPGRPDIQNGDLLRIRYVDRDGYIVKKIENQYNLINHGSIKGVKLYRLPMANGGAYIKFYDLFSQSSNLKKTKTVEYFYEETEESSILFLRDSIYTYTEYEYNDQNLFLKKERRYDNKKLDTETYYKYAFDFSDNTYRSMVNRHLMNNVVEKIITDNNKVIDGIKTTFTDTFNMSLPEKVYTLEFNRILTLDNYQQAYRPVLEFTKYNSDGELLESYNTKEKMYTSYLWSYNGKYPIAEIKNMEYSRTAEALGGESYVNSLYGKTTLSDTDWQKLEALRNNSIFRDTEVTLFKYNPLIGITRLSDPRGYSTYYEYDSFNRLKETYFYENNDASKKRIIETYEYNYRNK